jgi:hypothetical protein
MLSKISESTHGTTGLLRYFLINFKYPNILLNKIIAIYFNKYKDIFIKVN